jgi:hypothetical protein
MTQFVSSEPFVQPTPMRVNSTFPRTLHRLRIVAYILAVLVVAVLLSFVAPLGTWLLLSGAIGVTTLASILVVTTE